MTVASTTSRNDYTGNGAVDTYAYSFRIFTDADLKVTVRDEDGVETVLTLTTHYMVTGAGNANGGNVVLVDGDFDWIDADGDLVSGYTLTIRRVPLLKQLTDIRNQGAFFPETHENQFDKLVFIAQSQQDQIDRSAKLPETVDPADVDMTLPIPSAGKVIAWNDAGDGLENQDLAITETQYSGTISAGLDASKAASPTTDDMYVATDTKILYICFSSGTWTAFSITTGLAASKPASPKLGQVYIATDTAALYICAVAGAWTQLAPDGSLFTNLANIPSGAGRIPLANLPLLTPQNVVTLTDGATINTDASLGNYFKVTLGGNRTLANPTNPTTNQKVIFEFLQDGTGSRTITLGSDFIFGTDVTSVTLTTTASKRDLMACIYNGAKWVVVGFVRGYA